MSALRFHRINRPRLVGLIALICLWSIFALWQWTEYTHQRRLTQESLVAQADSIANAVRGSIQSHRWFGPFVQQQLPSTLETLARTKNVLSIAVVVNEDLDTIYSAGDSDRVDLALPVGDHLRADTLQMVREFTLEHSPPMMHSMHRDFSGAGSSLEFRSFIVVDRSSTLAQIERERSNRVLILALGTLLMLALASVWQVTVRIAHTEGRARVLELETRHLRELSQAAAGLAHETRNPLGLIRGWTQRLADTGLPGEAEQAQAVAVLEECDRVTARINQFLAFARQIEPNLEPILIGELVAES